MPVFIPSPLAGQVRATIGAFYADLRARRASGATTRAIAAEYHVSISTACRWLRLAGVALPRGRPRGIRGPGVNAARDASIMEEIGRGGVSFSDVARKFGITRERARQIAFAHGVTGPDIRGQSAARRRAEAKRIAQQEARTECRERRERLAAEILALHNAGMTQRSISVLVGLSQPSVSNLLARAFARQDEAA